MKKKSRRSFVQISFMTLTSLISASFPKRVSASELTPTPICDDDATATPPQIEGPFYTPNSPQRNSLLEPAIVGTKILLSGQVLYSNYQPIPRALLDFWHADDGGEYDTIGYRLRGHQFTDNKGRYFLETIVPGIYPGRTRHFHVKIKVPNRAILTTQLYFPGERRNRGDRFFMPELLMAVRDTDNGKQATFNFVVE